MILRLLGIGTVYGLGFALIKSLFPSPIILLMFSDATTGDGNPVLLVLVYMGSGLLAALIAAPIFAAFLFQRRKSRAEDGDAPSSGSRFVLSMSFGLLMGLISGVLILAAYAAGILPPGGVLDPLKLIRASNFPTGTPLLIAWTLARDMLPAGLTGLFLAPVGGGLLHGLYAGDSPLVQKTYDEDF